MSGKPVLRVGIISDVQAYAYSQDWGMHNCEKAFRILADQKIDVLMNGGDIADGGDSVAPLEYYQEMVKKYFTEKMPVQVSCAGNHDFWSHPGVGERSQEQIFSDFCRIFGDEETDPVCKTIAGYDFIAFSTNNKSNYSEEDCERLLRPALEKAVARDASKPIFVITHFQPKGTCAGGIKGGRAGLRKVFNDFPQVISFSSHSHCPLEDERCIWQGEFTAINTSSLSYGCIEERCVNVCGPILPFGREALGIMVMDIFEDRLEIHRYNAEDGHEIKPDRIWNIALPYSPADPVYSFERRAAVRTAPEFEPGTDVYFRIDYGFVYLVFNEAKHDDFTHFYRITATEIGPDGSDGKVMEFRYVSHFYRLLRNCDPRYVFRLPPNSVEPGKFYRYNVYPVETFGKEGKPISLTCQVPPHYTCNNVAEIGPQE